MAIVNNLIQNDLGNVADAIATDSISAKRPSSRQKPLVWAYVALLLFVFIYCARPGDWIPGLSKVPLAKITGILALLALISSLRRVRSPVPRELLYLILLTGQLSLAAVLSPVWQGGAVQVTLDFAKVLIVFAVMVVTVRTPQRLRLLIMTQAASVAVIAAVAVWNGRLLRGRLEGVLGGNYSNPNDLALAIVITLPLCLALLLLARGIAWKAAWALAMLVMIYGVFLTGSRAGFISLLVTAVVCLWEFAIRGRRRYLLVLAALMGGVFWQSSGGMVNERLIGTFDPHENVASAYSSSQARQEIFWRSIDITKQHPLFGVGPGNFQIVSGSWHVSHNSFTQMSSEGGIPALILFVMILWCSFKNVSAAKRLAHEQRELGILSRALAASLAGFIAGAIFASDAYQFFPYFLVAYSTALYWMAKQSASASKYNNALSEATRESEPHADTTGSQLSWHFR